MTPEAVVRQALLSMGFSGKNSGVSCHFLLQGFPSASDSKESVCYVGDPGSVPGLGRSPRKATHSSILAWRIPRTEEPGGLQFMESQRVGYD